MTEKPSDYSFSTCVATWLQTIFAGGILLLAYLAYQSWKDQEKAKRWAQITESIMTNTFSAMRCIEISTLHFYDPLPSEHQIDKIIKSAEDSLTNCKPDFEKVAKDVYWAYALSVPAGEAMTKFSEFLDNRDTDIFMLKIMRDRRTSKFKTEKDKEDNEDSFRLYVARLSVPRITASDEIPKGYTLEQIEKIKADWKSKKNAREHLAEAIKDIPKTLGPFIRLER